MKIHAIGKNQKRELEKKIVDVLNGRGEVVFAYLHGSFLEGNFRDIDVAIYLNELKGTKDALRYELALERVLEEVISFPVDVRILNIAPLPFRFGVIKQGLLLFSRDEGVRCDFECLTFVEHHDFDFHRQTYRGEALGII